MTGINPYSCARLITSHNYFFETKKVLERDLTDYTEYKQRVRYRLIPYVW